MTDPAAVPVPPPNSSVRVWDPVVRFGHWALVLAFAVAWLSAEDFMTVHLWSGYAVGAIVLVRLLWGVIGSRHARFANFVRGPAAVLEYLRGLVTGSGRRWLGHNPAGGAMVVALLLSLSGTVGSGLVLLAVEDQQGPLAGLVGAQPGAQALPPGAGDDDRGDDDRGDDEHGEESIWEEIHEVFSNLTLALVLVHVLGVLASSLVHRENLVRAMLTGHKRAGESRPDR